MPRFASIRRVLRRFPIYLIFLGAVLALTAVSKKSVTFDEFQDLPVGLGILRSGYFPVMNPPLCSVLPAAPLLLTGAKLDIEGFKAARTVFQTGFLFERDNTVYYQEYFILGRWISVLVFVLCCWLTYLLARRLYGPLSGVVAAAFVTLNPTFMGHGALLTPDIYLATSVVGFLYAFDRFFRKSNMSSAVWVGAAIGLSCLSKFTGLLLFPLTLVIYFSFAVRKRISYRQGAESFFVSIFVGVALINLGYLFQGSLTSLNGYTFHSQLFSSVLRHLPRWTGSVALPFPKPFIQALDRLFMETGLQSYFLGQVRQSTSRLYYIIGFLVKTPEILLAVLVISLLLTRKLLIREFPIFLLGAFFLPFFSWEGFKNIGVRYLLFLFPIGAIIAAKAVTCSNLRRLKVSRKRRLVLSGLAMLFLALTAGLAWPDYISYFNWISGGRDHGHAYLLDSNLDWGQDLVELSSFMEKNSILRIDLAYFGMTRPELYGIDYVPTFGMPHYRYTAISANFLWGQPAIVNGYLLMNGRFYPRVPTQYEAYRSLRPVAILGGSIYVFDMLAPTSDEAQR